MDDEALVNVCAISLTLTLILTLTRSLTPSLTLSITLSLIWTIQLLLTCALIAVVYRL